MDTKGNRLSKLIWQKIITDLGIPSLPKPKINDINYLQKKVNELLDSIPFEEDELLESMDKDFVTRWAKDLKLPITDLLQSNEIYDTRIDTLSMLNKEELGKWSDEAYELGVLLVKLNYLPQICNETYIKYYFKSFRFDNEKIISIDEPFKQFDKLQRLSLSHNKISVLQNLPPNLIELNLYDNLITEIKNINLLSLKHLGIGYNKLSNLSIFF